MINPSSRFPIDVESDPTHLAAADWLVRLQSTEVSVEDTLAWQSWLNEKPTNAQAFAQLEELSQVLRDVRPPGVVSPRRFARDRYDASVAINDWHEPNALHEPWVTMAAGTCLAAVVLVIAMWKAHPAIDTFKTAIGENRNVTLSDGSRIALGADTQIDVSLAAKERNIELTRGEALFMVAKDAARPFTVHAGDVTVVAVGTAFNVERDSDRAVVSVTEGRVVVEPVTRFLPVAILHEFKPKLRSVHLDAGQQTTAGSAGIEEPTNIEDTAAGWQVGRLAFHLQPLHYVLEDVNRYAHKPIVLEGENVGALVITGTVERENIQGWVRSLERAFDLQATEEADRIVLRLR